MAIWSQTRLQLPHQELDRMQKCVWVYALSSLSLSIYIYMYVCVYMYIYTHTPVLCTCIQIHAAHANNVYATFTCRCMNKARRIASSPAAGFPSPCGTTVGTPLAGTAGALAGSCASRCWLRPAPGVAPQPSSGAACHTDRLPGRGCELSFF